jgi:phosphonate metabolism protein PhnN/1,5-bisphosphokinase (PRPP-forming)
MGNERAPVSSGWSKQWPFTLWPNEPKRQGQQKPQFWPNEAKWVPCTSRDRSPNRRQSAGGFAFWWQAHGLKYAVPGSVADDIRAGRTVICNVSRATVADVRARYAVVDVVLVTAPADILVARLAGRSRGSDGPLEQRIKRNDAYAGFRADYTINNVGAPRTAARQLLAVLQPAKPEIA